MSSSELVLEISRLSHDGRGIAFTAGPGSLAVFVPGALPGQKARCRIVKKNHNFQEAELVEVISSPPLSDPICAHHGECGGCPLQRLRYGDQLFWKESILRNALLRIGGLTEDKWGESWLGLKSSPALVGCRNKLVLAFESQPTGLRLGLRIRNSHSVIPVRCSLLPEYPHLLINSFLDALRQSCFPQHLLRFLVVRHARTLAGSEMGWHLVLITGPTNSRLHAVIKKIAERLLGDYADIQSFILEERRVNDYLAAGEKRILSLARTLSPMALALHNRLFALDAASFFQVNPGASELLADCAIQMLGMGEGNLLDLYCGAGSPGQLLPGFDKHLGIEYDKRSVNWAKFNAGNYGLDNWEYKSGNAAKIFMGLKNLEEYATVLADPPRQGLQKEILRGLLQGHAKRILYISCEPSTFARDASRLQEQYNLAKMQGIDMFPHTPHMEICSLWEKK